MYSAFTCQSCEAHITMSVRILIATDAWLPQTNGVVSTLRQTVAQLSRTRSCGAVADARTDFNTLACPGYAEIRLALGVQSALREQFEEFRPEAVHIATEGPIGLAVRAHCVAHRYRFTTSYHTQFPAVPAQATAGAAAIFLFDAALVPCVRRALHGQHAFDAQRTGGQGISQPGALAARRGFATVPAQGQELPARCRDPLLSTWADWRWKRTSTRSWACNGRAASW